MVQTQQSAAILISHPDVVYHLYSLFVIQAGGRIYVHLAVLAVEL